MSVDCCLVVTCRERVDLLDLIRNILLYFVSIPDLCNLSYVNNTLLPVANKASNITMSVPIFIYFHKLRCSGIHNYHNYTILVLVKVLKVVVNNRDITLCIPKLQ